MQRIERYGVIALVLFLVTIVAVSFWDDGTAMVGAKEPKANERLAGRQNQRPTPRTKNAGNPGNKGRALPATSGGNQPRKPKQQKPAPTGGKQGARQNQNLQFETLPSTVASQERKAAPAEQVQFPESLTVPDPRPQPKPNRPATNYDTIQQRSQALAQRDAERRKREASTNQAAKRSAANTPVQAAMTAAGTYKVQPGDTLSEISFKTLGTSKRWREIQALNNNLDPSQLSVDMVLRLPGGAALASPASFSKNKNSAASVALSSGDYVVQKGDVLSQIAQDELGGASRWREIAKLNPTIDPNRLMEGAVLNMPGASSSALARLSTTPQPSRKKNRVR